MLSLKLQGAVRRFQQLVDIFLTGGRFPEFPQLAVAGSFTGFPTSPPRSETSFLDSLKDGFLWAVPKKRKSLEKRQKKQWGSSYMWQVRHRDDLIVCLHCGNHHEAHSLCGHCYQKVKEETKLIQEAMNIKERNPELQSQEVVVLYEEEGAELVTSQGKRIVEVPKKRPLWFSSELLTKPRPLVKAPTEEP